LEKAQRGVWAVNKISKFPYSEAKESIKYYCHVGNISKEARNKALRALKQIRDAVAECDITAALSEYDDLPDEVKQFPSIRRFIGDMIRKSCGMGEGV